MYKIRVCVFCNKKPVSKTKEHVIPLWLIKLTGNENRPIIVRGVGKGEKTTPFDFKSFTFPACDECNNKFSKLEDRAEICITKLINKETLSSEEFEIIMDWLDKVRIGLWLGSVMFSKNPLGITPKFGIADRPKKDRLLLISLSAKSLKRLNFTSFDDPLFHLLPCVLGMYINGAYLISVSADGLLSNEIPLPNIDILKQDSVGNITATFRRSSKSVVTIPYIGKRYTTIAQINFPRKINRKYFKENQISYIKKDSMSSKVLMIKKNKMFIYEAIKSNSWRPEEYQQMSITELFEKHSQKILRLRSWAAKKMFGTSPNKVFRKFYNDLIKGGVIKGSF